MRTASGACAAEHRNVRLCMAPHGDWKWLSTARTVRGTQDYLRYFDKHYTEASVLLERAVDKTVGFRFAARIRRFPGVSKRDPDAIARYQQWLAKLEASLPTDPQIDAFLRSRKPDIVVVTPLINFRSDQVDFIKSCRGIGIPSVLAVASWDNLTKKGLIRVSPEAVFVWNNAQKDEAITLHSVEPERVVLTGAHSYDDWKSRTVSRVYVVLPQGRAEPQQPFYPLRLLITIYWDQEGNFIREGMAHELAQPRFE